MAAGCSCNISWYIVVKIKVCRAGVKKDHSKTKHFHAFLYSLMLKSRLFQWQMNQAKLWFLIRKLSQMLKWNMELFTSWHLSHSLVFIQIWTSHHPTGSALLLLWKSMLGIWPGTVHANHRNSQGKTFS